MRRELISVCVVIFMLLGGISVLAGVDVDGGGKAQAAGELERLIAERDELKSELPALSAKLDGFRSRERELRGELREAAEGRSKLVDKTTVDEESAKLIDEIEKLEARVKELRVELGQRLKNNPENIERQARFGKVYEKIGKSRKERIKLEHDMVARKRRLYEVEKLIAEKKAAAEKSEADATGSGEGTLTPEDDSGVME